MIKRWLVPFFGRPARSMNLLFSVTTLLIANSIVALFLTETTSLMVLALLGQSVLIWLIVRILDRGLRSLLRKKGGGKYLLDRSLPIRVPALPRVAIGRLVRMEFVFSFSILLSLYCSQPGWVTPHVQQRRYAAYRRTGLFRSYLLG
jgi:hypothetical protein